MLGKVLQAKLPDIAVPVQTPDGEYVVRFENHRAIAPDHIALALTRMSDFYRIVRDVWREPLRKVLLVRDGGAGDILLTTPLIRRLAQSGIQVHYVTRPLFAPLLENNPYVAGVQVADLIPEPWNRLQGDDFDMEGARADFDAVIDLRWHAERAESEGFKGHRAASFFTALEMEAPGDLSMDLFLTEEERSDAQLLIGELRPACAYVWASTTANRNWSDAQHERGIAALVDKGFTVFLLDQEPVGGGPHIVDLGGQLTLRQACAVIEACDVVVTPDTGLFHAAQALKMPTLGYFGPFPASTRATAQLVTVNDQEACRLWPCHGYRCAYAGTPMENICLGASPDRLAEEAIRLCRSVKGFSTRRSRGDGRSSKPAAEAALS